MLGWSSGTSWQADSRGLSSCEGWGDKFAGCSELSLSRASVGSLSGQGGKGCARMSSPFFKALWSSQVSSGTVFHQFQTLKAVVV